MDNSADKIEELLYPPPNILDVRDNSSDRIEELFTQNLILDAIDNSSDRIEELLTLNVLAEARDNSSDCIEELLTQNILIDAKDNSGERIEQIDTGVIVPVSPQVIALAVNTGPQTQTELQAMYDAEPGLDAPDTVPAEVTTASDNAPHGYFSVYLGHNTWYWRLNGGISPWEAFNNGGKNNFSNSILAVFTYK